MEIIMEHKMLTALVLVPYIRLYIVANYISMQFLNSHIETYFSYTSEQQGISENQLLVFGFGMLSQVFICIPYEKVLGTPLLSNIK